MIANIVIALGLVIAALAFLEFILSEPQKTAVSNWTLRAWMQLAEVQTKADFRAAALIKRFSDALDQGGGFLTSAGVVVFVTCLATIGWKFYSNEADTENLVPVLLGYTFLLLLLIVLMIVLALVALNLAILVYIPIALLWSVELLVRRMAEYPKGPIIAAGIILAALVALLKTVN